jgi:hypothetical protein
MPVHGTRRAPLVGDEQEVPMPEREEKRSEQEERGGVQPQPGTAEPMDASAYAASSSESGGLYREEGPTIADAEGEPVGDDEEPAEKPEDRPDVGDVYRSGS